MQNIHQHKILIIDFGSQYTQLIARRIREIGVYCEIHSYEMPENEIKEFHAKGIILSGGPESVTEKNSPRAPEIIFKLNIPVLGICYGMQTMAEQLGGKVSSGDKKEFGYAKVELHGNSQLFQGIEDEMSSDSKALLDVWMSHGDKVNVIPHDFHVIAKTNNCPVAAMADDNRHFYGIQFHPEVTHTKQGLRILERFVKEICQCQTLWNAHNIIEDLISHIQKTVGKEKVLLGLSGGVDSSVVAALLHKAIGSQLVCVFVDHGLLRLNERKDVEQTFGKHFGIDLHVVDAKDRFYKALENIHDPEEKRKIIGREFIHVFEEQAKKLKDISLLAQGTIYPDVVESAATKHGKAHVIKSHHNVGGLPENLPFKLIEPLRELFKDEVRKIGLELGLPYDLVYRHPFPGPGLGVRILGEISEEAAIKLQKADHIFIEELHKHDLYHKVSQAFAVFLPVKSVGVVGDGRQYEPVIALRAVETIDFMTAHWAQLPYDFLAHVSLRIINEVPGISRVVYDISGKPPATIEWE